MGQYLLALVAALVVGAVIFGVVVLVTGADRGLGRVEPDSRAVPLPGTRPLAEGDVDHVRFDTVLRGYRMAQVDAALRRAAYDIGYKDELIGVLEAEVAALREGRTSDAEVLRRAREAALAPVGTGSTDGYAERRPASAARGSVDADGSSESSGSADEPVGSADGSSGSASVPAGSASDSSWSASVPVGSADGAAGSADGAAGSARVSSWSASEAPVGAAAPDAEVAPEADAAPDHAALAAPDLDVPPGAARQAAGASTEARDANAVPPERA
jgi:DivIVA domain-containing protein